MKPIVLSRRFVLAAAGVRVGLPFMEAMMPRKAGAQAAVPRRVLFAIGAHALGVDHPGGRETDPQYFNMHLGETLPVDTGPNYTLPQGWEPLKGLRDRIGAVSGLTGAGQESHVIAYSDLMTGRHDRIASPATVTADRALIPVLRAESHKFPCLVVSSTTLPQENVMSHAGPQRFPGVNNPRALFNSLFGNFQAAATPAEVAERDREQLKAISVLDRVLEQSSSLRRQLGRVDRLRLEAHLQSIRDLEVRLTAMPPPVDSRCAVPAQPQVLLLPANQPYPDWALDAFVDLIVLAFACDLTRIVTWSLTDGTGGNIVNTTVGANDLHAINHGIQPRTTSFARDNALGMRYNLAAWARVVERLAAMPEGAGTMLDNSLLIYMPEFGWGSTPYVPRIWGHSDGERLVIYATGIPGLKVGHHTRVPPVHSASALLTFMRHLGYTGNLGTATLLPEVLG